MAEEPKPVTEEELVKIEELFDKWYEEKDESTLEEIFAVFDRDGNGYIEKAEVLAMQKAVRGEIDLQEADKEIAAADTNNDGKLSKEEFFASMKDDS